MTFYSPDNVLPVGNIIFSNFENNYSNIEEESIPNKIVKIIYKEPDYNETLPVHSLVLNDNNFLIKNENKVVVQPEALLCYNGMVVNEPLNPPQIIFTVELENKSVLINGTDCQGPVNQLILANPVNDSNLITYTCSNESVNEENSKNAINQLILTNPVNESNVITYTCSNESVNEEGSKSFINQLILTNPVNDSNEVTYACSNEFINKDVSQKPINEIIIRNHVNDSNEIGYSYPNEIINKTNDQEQMNQIILTNSIDLSNKIAYTCTNETMKEEIKEKPISQLIISNPVEGSNEMMYTCSNELIKRDIVLKTKVSDQDMAENPVFNTGVSEQVDGNISSQEQYNEMEEAEKGDGQVTETSNGRKKSNNCDKNKIVKVKTKLVCSFCDKIFEKQSSLQIHQRVHTKERPFQCIVCGRAFSQKSNVRKHMLRHKVWPQGKHTLSLSTGKVQKNQDLENQMSYSCQYCSSSFNFYAGYKKHLSVHNDLKVYRCLQKGCDETFSDLDEFLSHSKEHSSLEFQCHICLKAFTSLEDLGIHQYDHDTTGKHKKDKKKRLKCKICRSQFKSMESLKNHLAVDSHKYECIKCKRIFYSERFLRRHLIIHLDPNKLKFKCKSCKKAFRSQKSLDNHVFIHIKDKPFTCDYCQKQFCKKFRLERHIAVHLGHYLECPCKKLLGCDKIFYRKDKLKDHIGSHTQLHSCKTCLKTFQTSVKLNQHIKRVHKIKNGVSGLKCSNCSQTFRKEKQMEQHHCTVYERKLRPREKKLLGRSKPQEKVSNIEIIMVPFT